MRAESDATTDAARSTSEVFPMRRGGDDYRVDAVREVGREPLGLLLTVGKGVAVRSDAEDEGGI